MTMAIDDDVLAYLRQLASVCEEGWQEGWQPFMAGHPPLRDALAMIVRDDPRFPPEATAAQVSVISQGSALALLLAGIDLRDRMLHEKDLENVLLEAKVAAMRPVIQRVAEADNSDSSVCYQVCPLLFYDTGEEGGEFTMRHEGPCVVAQAEAAWKLLRGEARYEDLAPTHGRTTPPDIQENAHVRDRRGQWWCYSEPTDTWRMREQPTPAAPVSLASARSYQRLEAEFGPLYRVQEREEAIHEE